MQNKNTLEYNFSDIDLEAGKYYNLNSATLHIEPCNNENNNIIIDPITLIDTISINGLIMFDSKIPLHIMRFYENIKNSKKKNKK